MLSLLDWEWGEISTHNAILQDNARTFSHLIKARLRNNWQIKKEDIKNVTVFPSVCKCTIVYVENSKTSELGYFCFYNKAPQTRWLKHQIFISSWFWRLDVQAG